MSVTVLDDVEDVDEAAEQVRRLGYRPNRITPLSRPASLKARVGVVPARDAITYGRISYGADVEVRPTTAEADTFMLVLALTGQAQVTYGTEIARVRAGVGGFIPPYKEFRSVISADFDQVLLAINRVRLERLAALLLDHPDDRLIEFNSVTDWVPPSDALLHVTSAALHLSGDPLIDHDERVQTRLESTVIETALLAMPSFRARIEDHGAASSRATRTAMAFMRENLAEPLTVSEIASAAMTSPRALQSAFSRDLATTPMRWLRDQRLARARSLLSSADASHLSIAEIAHASGFLHLGDFSRRYRERYHMKPSESRLPRMR